VGKTSASSTLPATARRKVAARDVKSIIGRESGKQDKVRPKRTDAA
jgi:hypothetical protein